MLSVIRAKRRHSTARFEPWLVGRRIAPKRRGPVLESRRCNTRLPQRNLAVKLLVCDVAASATTGDRRSTHPHYACRCFLSSDTPSPICSRLPHLCRFPPRNTPHPSLSAISRVAAKHSSVFWPKPRRATPRRCGSPATSSIAAPNRSPRCAT